MGIRYALTVDHDTLEDNTVTLREILTTKQIRIPVPESSVLLVELTAGRTTWSELLAKYPNVEASAADEDKKE